MAKTYNTPKRTHIVKTRLDDEEYAEFMRRMKLYEMSQAEFIREAISGATIKPAIVASLVNDDLLAAVGKLTAEYGRLATISTRSPDTSTNGEALILPWQRNCKMPPLISLL